MSSLHYITGGAKSGKSDYALSLAKEVSGNTVFIATAIPFDLGMQRKIKKHQETRPKNWKTIEQYKEFKNLAQNEVFLEADTILLDCLTLLVSNQLMDFQLNWEKIDIDRIQEAEEVILKDIIDLIELSKDKNLIIVSNEIGMGIVPDNYLSSYFRDILGRINQYIAQEADTVSFLVSGIPISLK